MEDLNRLASSLAAGVSDVRACLILSRDGLVVGSHPSDVEDRAKPAWVRFAGLGETERGFAQFGTETWCFVRRGPYAAFALTGPSVRPGLVLDQMDQMLLAAEENRMRRDGPRSAEVPSVPPAPTAFAGRPRTPLHPEPRPPQEPVVISGDLVIERLEATAELDDSFTPAAAEPFMPTTGAPTPAETLAGSTEPSSDPMADGSADPVAEGSEPGEEGPWGGVSETGEIDRFSLAREFGQLLQDDGDGADG